MLSMERRKLYNRGLRSLPPSTRWRESKRMDGVGTVVDIDLAERDDFAEQLLSGLGARSRLHADDYLPERTSGSQGL